MTDINIEIFRRINPKKKLEIINKLSDEEIFLLSMNSILKILKECGSRVKGSRDRIFRFSEEGKKGNDWNSTIESLELRKNTLFVDIYFQYSNTDIVIPEYFAKFFKRGKYDGHWVGVDSIRCNPRTFYFSYSDSDKAQVLKSLCTEYINRKYADKLNN